MGTNTVAGMDIQRRKFASIDTLEAVAPEVSLEDSPESASEGSLIVVLFHGYGANAYDLLSLHHQLRSPEKTSWYFPEGLIRLDLFSGTEGRAWFPINTVEIEKAAASGNYQQRHYMIPQGFTEAVAKAEKMLKEIYESRNKKARILVGGFSQGAMIASDLYLRSSLEIEGLIILSGTLLNQKEWQKLAEEKGKAAQARSPMRKIDFFQSHGIFDPLLPYKSAQELELLLKKANLKGNLHSFEGGHQIPPSVLGELGSWLCSI